MSTISKIKARRLDDLVNEGYSTTLVGTVGTVTDSTLIGIPSNRAVVVTGFTLSTNNAGPILVSLGLKNGSNPTTTIFQMYMGSASPAEKTYSIGDWKYGELADSLVITSAGSTVAYSIDIRIISSPVALGYVEHDGATGHSAPWFPPASGLARGQSEV
jgi:hypothetical protein